MEIGNTLKTARESREISLETVEERTKIRRKYLEALEEERFDILPGRVYVKGFLKNYADFLGMDPRPLLAAFDEIVAPDKEEELDVKEFISLERPIAEKAGWKIVLGVAVVALVAAFIYFPLQQSGEDPVDNPNPSGPEHGAVIGSGNQPEQQAEPPASESPTVIQEGVNLILNVTNNESWMYVEVDGKSVFEGLVQAGQSKEFKGNEKISFRLGNAGVVEVELNGQKMGVLGERGEVITKEFKATQG